MFRRGSCEKVSRAGWIVDRQVGSHVMLVKENYPYTLSVPQHKELGIGLLRSLIKQADLTVQEFNRKNSSELAPGLPPEGKARETIGFSNTEFYRSKDSNGASFIKGKQKGLLKSSYNRNRIPRSLLRGAFIYNF